MTAEEQYQPAIVREFELADGAATGFVVIDSLLGGGGTGGIRAGGDITLDEVATLAREMSDKFAWLNIVRGGAKSGIRFHPGSRAEALEIFRSFGAGIRDLIESGRYIAGLDLGVGDAEFREVMLGAGATPGDPDTRGDVDSNYYTALTVFIAIRTMAQFRGLPASGSTVLVEGVGKVGRHLLRMLDAAGFRVVGASTLRGALYAQDGIDVDRLVSLAESAGDDCVAGYGDGPVLAAADLYRQSADILVPGARVNVIGEADVDRLAVAAVVPVANAAATPGAERAMHARGISYLPGFVCNSGGIFCWYMAGQSPETRRSLLEREYSARVAALLAGARRRDMSIAELARRQARRNVERMAAGEAGGGIGRFAGMARKFSPRRLPYVLLRKLLGRSWARRDSVFVHWYFRSRYFS